MIRVLAAAAVLAGGALAAPASAATQAPGAPGAVHVWAPADKHGFGTARQAQSNVAFTLRESSLSEVYFPDLSTPSFRGLQFAVARRPDASSARSSTTTRATSSRSPRACARACRRCRARSRSARSPRRRAGS